VDDAIVDGTQTVTFTAFVTIDGYAISEGKATATLDVTDDDGPTLSVVISRDVVAEDATNPAATATIYRNTDTTDPLDISLASSDTSEITVQETATIPAGWAYVVVELNVVNDGVPDGLQTATITASAGGFTAGFDSIDVTDVDLPDLLPQVVELPADGLTETPVTITWRVTNQGLDAVTGSWLDEVYISTDDRLGGDELAGALPFAGTLEIDEWYERSLQVWLPASPGQYWIIIKTDAHNTAEEIPGTGERNNSAVSTTWIDATPEYRAAVATEVETAPAGTPVPMTGYAFHSITGQPQPDSLVTIRVRNSSGFRRVISVMTNDQGTFEATFNPLPDEGGVYEIGADHPNVSEDPTQDTFTLIGIKPLPKTISQRLFPGTPVTGTARLRNLSPVPLTGITATVQGIAPNLDVDVTVGQTLPGDVEAEFSYTLEASDASVSWNSFGVVFTSLEGAQTAVTFNVTIVEQQPQLTCTPGTLRGGMLRGRRKLVEFAVSNLGGAPSGDLSVMLPDIGWMSLASSPVLPALPPGEGTNVTLALNPPDNLPLTAYNGSIVITDGVYSVSLPFQFRAVSEAKGDLQVTVVDDYTFHVEGAPKVAGATVTLIDPIDQSTVAEGTSDQDGTCLLTDIPQMEYILRVKAPRHGTYNAG